MKTRDWDSLKLRNARDRIVAVPTLSAFFYFARPVHEIASALATAIEKYVDLVGLQALPTYVADSGDLRKMTRRKFNKDLKLLRDFPTDYVGANVDYDANEAGEPAELGVFARATDFSLNFESERANVFRIDFPPTWLESHPVDEFIALIVEFAALQDVQSANVGFAFKRRDGESSATRVINAKLGRYLAFDPCYDGSRDNLRGKVLSAHWLNYLDEEMATAVGGVEAITAALPACEIRPLPGGVLIRGAERPPIGDSNYQAPDLGCLPDVARLLKPLRPAIHAFGEPAERFDGGEWLSRFDELDARPWQAPS